MLLALRILAISLAALCTLPSAVEAKFAFSGRGAAAVTSTYTDLCSQTGLSGNCVYGYSVTHRLNSTSTSPFTLTLTSNGATYNAAYTGASFYVDVAAEETFCLSNGGSTTHTAATSTTPGFTTYNDCKITQLNDQVSSCNLTSLETNKLFSFRVLDSDGYPALIATTRSNGSVGTTQPWLTGFGCSARVGNVSKSLITYSSNAYGSSCCGNQGLMENGSGPNPTRPITIVNGSMFAQSWFWPGGVGTNVNFCVDLEGNGSNCIILSNSPPQMGVGLNTFSGFAAGNKYNEFFNNVQGTPNQTPTETINTQSRINIGCSGDLTGCGPILTRDLVITSNDLSATTGLPTAIYTYITNIYSGISSTPVITFNAPSASYIYPSASGTALTTVTATVSPGSFLSGGGTFTSSNCSTSDIAVASAGAVTVAGPSNLTGSQSCLITAHYPGATDVTQTFNLTGTQQTIASITSTGGCTLGGGCSYTFTNSASPVTLDAIPTVTMSGGISFSAGGGTITLPVSGANCNLFSLSAPNLQITQNTPGTYTCNYNITDPSASNTPQTPSISAVGSNNPTTNVTAVALSNENAPLPSASGTAIGDFSATVNGTSSPCTTCTWVFATSGTPTGQVGPGCSSANTSKFQLVPFGSGQAHLQEAVTGLTPQIYGAPPASQTFLCVTATPAVGTARTFAYSTIVRAPSFDAVTPLTIEYTPGVAGSTNFVSTICWANCGQGGSPPTTTYTLGGDAACGPGLSFSGATLSWTTAYSGNGVCHITAAASGVICPPLGYTTGTPTTCTVPVMLRPTPYAGPGDIAGVTWTKWNGPYGYSNTYCASGNNPVWQVIRERDQATFTANCRPNGDMDIAGLAAFCDSSMCYQTTSPDNSGHSTANDDQAWADLAGHGSPLTIWRPAIYFNVLNGVPSLSNSNGTDRFMQNFANYNGSGSTGTIEAVGMQFASGSITGQLVDLNDSSNSSTNASVVQFSALPNVAEICVGPALGCNESDGAAFVRGGATGGVFHSVVGVLNGNSSNLYVDGVANPGTLPTTASLILPEAEGGGYGGGSLSGWMEEVGISSTPFNSTQAQSLCQIHAQHYGTSCTSPVQTINSVFLSSNTFSPGSASGTVVGTIADPAMVAPLPVFAGSCCTLSGADAASFQIVSPYLETNGVLSGGPYHINLVATQPGLTTLTAPKTITATAARDYVAFGDSITVGQGASPTTNGYAYLIAGDKGYTLTDMGVSGIWTCGAGTREVFPNFAPVSTDGTLYTILLGTNDAINNTAGPHEAVYKQCLMAEASWLAIPNTSKVYAQTATVSGSWVVDDSDFVPTIARSVPEGSSPGSTLTFPSVAVRSGVMYIWAYFQSGVAAFSYAIDGGSPTTVAAFAGGSVGVTRITGLTNTTHSVVITDTAGHAEAIAGVGTVPATIGCCRTLVGGVLQQLNDASSANTAAYNADALSVASTLTGDGLNVAGVIVRDPGTTNPPTPNSVCDTSTCMADIYHPNNTGHRYLANAFESTGL